MKKRMPIRGTASTFYSAYKIKRGPHTGASLYP